MDQPPHERCAGLLSAYLQIWQKVSRDICVKYAEGYDQVGKMSFLVSCFLLFAGQRAARCCSSTMRRASL